MKIRNGFVSNSSSASFVIKKENLTECQVEDIKNHRDVCKRYDAPSWAGEWYVEWGYDIFENDNEIWGSTNMDNFDMLYFLKCIGVEREYIDWRDHI